MEHSYGSKLKFKQCACSSSCSHSLSHLFNQITQMTMNHNSCTQIQFSWQSISNQIKCMQPNRRFSAVLCVCDWKCVISYAQNNNNNNKVIHNEHRIVTAIYYRWLCSPITNVWLLLLILNWKEIAGGCCFNILFFYY